MDVKDQNNTNATPITCGSTCVNSGNNLRWFGAESSGTTGYVPPQPHRVTLLSPNGGDIFQVGDTMQIAWSTTGTAITAIDISLSRDDGNSFKTIATQTQNDGNYSWVATGPSTSLARIRPEGTDGSSVVSTDLSDSGFTIVETSTQPEPPTTPPVNPPELTNGDLIKLETSSTVYMITEGNIIRPFFNPTIFHIYERDFSRVRTVTVEEFSSYTLGSMMLPEPGSVLVKVRDDARVYAVQENPESPRTPIIRWLASEEIASSIYGTHWADYVIDVDPAILAAFVPGADITSLEDIDIAPLRTRFELVLKRRFRWLK